MVLAIPVLSSSYLKKMEILNPLHIEPRHGMEMENLPTGSSCSYFDLPHILLLLHYLATIRKSAFEKATVINHSLFSWRLSIRIIAYHIHNFVTATIIGLRRK